MKEIVQLQQYLKRLESKADFTTMAVEYKSKKATKDIIRDNMYQELKKLCEEGKTLLEKLSTKVTSMEEFSNEYLKNRTQYHRVLASFSCLRI